MKNKTAILMTILVIFAAAMMSCEDAGTTSTPDPRFRVSNESGSSRYFNIGIHDSGNNTAELAGTWVLVSNNSASEYQSVPVGNYRVYRDEDTDHSSFSYLSENDWEFVAGKTYLIQINPDTYSVTEE